VDLIHDDRSNVSEELTHGMAIVLDGTTVLPKSE